MVFGGHKAVDQPDPSIPAVDEVTGEHLEGKCIVLFANGDRYIGCLKAGKKEGWGMYVYADLTAYKGEWVDDCLDGVRHPIGENQLPVEVKKLHNFNERNHALVEALKQQ